MATYSLLHIVALSVAAAAACARGAPMAVAAAAMVIPERIARRLGASLRSVWFVDSIGASLPGLIYIQFPFYDSLTPRFPKRQAMRKRATAASSHTIPAPGRSGTIAMPSTMD